jgi:4-hydroxybenzoate polyprenyltransferase
MRSAGCIINDYFDREIDGHIERTKNRPLPMGEIMPHHALIMFLVLGLKAFFLVLLTNWLTILIAIGAVTITAIYPLLKRITNLPQLGLGIAWAFVVPMAFAAEKQHLIPEIGYLCLLIISWTLMFDTYYALVDKEDDLKIGVKSTAILFGKYLLPIMISLKVFIISLLVLVGLLFDLMFPYYLGIFVASLFFLKHSFYLNKNEGTLFFKAFLENNYVGLAIFTGIFFGI